MNCSDMKKFMHSIYRIASRIQLIRNTEIQLKMGITLNSASLAALEMIDKEPNCKMSEISAKMGITKGAISQMARKLEEKGLIKRQKTQDNAKEVYLRVTESGEKALKEYQKLHSRLYNGMEQVLSTYSAQEMQAISRFLMETGTFLEDFIENPYEEV